MAAGETTEELSARRKLLPIYHARDEILEGLKKSPIILIVGSTGCGKSTQVCICRAVCAVARRRHVVSSLHILKSVAIISVADTAVASIYLMWDRRSVV